MSQYYKVYSVPFCSYLPPFVFLQAQPGLDIYQVLPRKQWPADMINFTVYFINIPFAVLYLFSQGWIWISPWCIKAAVVTHRLSSED